MGFSLSPSVVVNERDLTSIIPAVSTSTGAFAGIFPWGPVMDPVTISSEDNLVERFGAPNDDNFHSFFTAANFLAYSNNLLVNRIDGADLKNAVVTPGVSSVKIANAQDYLDNHASGDSTYGPFSAKFPGSAGNGLLISMADSTSFAAWDYSGLFSVAPGTSTEAAAQGGSNDELHIVIIDALGKFTGEPLSVLEKYEFVSKSKDSRRSDGTNNYYRDVLNSRSKYVWHLAHPVLSIGPEVLYNFGGELSVDFDVIADPISLSLSGGADDWAPTDGNTQDAFDVFSNDELYDISLIPVGKANATVAQFVIQNVAEIRKDCVAFVSPQDTDSGDPIIGYGSDAVTATKAYRTALNLSSSYGFLDSGYKYQYDRYNDVFRYVPLNGDIAGLAARTDFTNDPWFSPAGLNRGQIKNVVKLAFNPGKTERDNLYQAGINPVVNFPGQGVVLFGDKTLLAKPSAFDRINVRRLFIVLEKAIATAAKYQLFEFNDSFTRAQFKNLVEPFLRDVQGRRGLTDFRVVCDERNNTGEVIDRNEFIADIYLKPSRSINFIYLNFIATRTGISFEEVGA